MAKVNKLFSKEFLIKKSENIQLTEKQKENFDIWFKK
jgi:hypothetical protein